MNTIDKKSKIPLYIQLMNIIIYKIEHFMQEDDQLDSERDICQKYYVSRTTVRQALDELEKKKYIYKVQGKGNFIAPKIVAQDLIKVSSFTDEMNKLGKKPASKLLALEIIEPDHKIINKLNLKKDSLVFKIIRLRLADDVPHIYETSYLPYDRFEGLTRELLGENPMYEVLKNNFKIKISSAEEILESILINKLESIYLSIPQGNPALKIERITYDNNTVIEYTISIARADKFKYRVHLKS